MTTKGFRQIVAGLLALGLFLAAPAASAQTYFWWQVLDQRGRPYPAEAIRCSVFDVGPSHATAAGAGGAKVLHFSSSLSEPGSTMPLRSDANSRLHFWSTSSANVRVLCYYERGGAATDVLLSKTTHEVLIDREGRKVVRFQFVRNTTPTRTGVWFGPGDLIRDVLVNVPGGWPGPKIAAEPSAHLNVGFAGAHTNAIALGIHVMAGMTTTPAVNALIHQMSMSLTEGGTTGLFEWFRPGFRIAQEGTASAEGSAGGASNLPLLVASHRGAALALFSTGCVNRAGCAVDGAHAGVYLEHPYMVQRDLEVTYTTSGVDGFSGHVYIIYEQYHTGSAYGGPSQPFSTP